MMVPKPKESKRESLKGSLKFDDSDVNPSHLVDSLSDNSKKLFLRRFKEEDLYSIMEKIGLVKHLKNMGFKSLITEIDVDDAGINYLKLYWDEKTHARQLIDLRVSELTYSPDSKYFPQDGKILPYNMIMIEWLSAKNPMKEFDGHRPQLPGQANPGLGVLRFCFRVLYIIAKLVFKDGFIDIPNHMHGAIMYSRKFKFFDPIHEGIIRAIIRDLKKYSLSDISWGILTETIMDLEKNKPVVYAPGPQIHYVSRRMKKYFKSRKYIRTYKFYYKKKKYSIDYEEMIKRKEAIIRFKEIADL